MIRIGRLMAADQARRLVDGPQVLTAAVAGCRNRKGAFVYGSCRIALAVFGRAQGNAIIRRDTLCDWSADHRPGVRRQTLFARRRCAFGGRQLGIVADLTQAKIRLGQR
jgi:hypothetical protein